MMKYANLHMHSYFSDGIRSPQELCELAVQKGYKAVALTDHETVRGLPVMKKAAEEAGLRFITGIEVMAVGCGLPKGTFHIVGLDFDPEHPSIKAYTDWTESNSKEATRVRLEYCIEHGIFSDITWEEVQQRFPDVTWFCNEQVFKTLQEKQGLKDEWYWEFIQHFNGAPVKSIFNALDAAQAIEMIRSAGGIAVLAHPYGQTQYLPALHELGLNGVEIDHPQLNDYDRAEAERLADELNLYRSGGSDHYGLLGNSMKRGNGSILSKKPQPYTADVENGITLEQFETILNRKLG